MHLQIVSTQDTGLRGVDHLVFSAPEQLLLAAGDAVCRWDWQAGRQIAQAPAACPLHQVRAILATAASVQVIDNDPQRGETWLADLATGERRLIARGRQAYKAACSRPPAIIALGGNQRITLLSWPKRRLLGELAGHQDGVRDMTFSPDGRLLASIGGESEDEQHRDAVRLWDVQRCGELQSWLHHHLGSLAFHPSGGVIAVGCTAPAAIKLWDMRSGSVETDSSAAGLQWVNALAFSADGRHLCAGNHDGQLLIYHVDL